MGNFCRSPLRPLLAVLLLAASTLHAQEPAPVPTYRLDPHADTIFAHDLLRLGQINAIAAESKITHATDTENLWRAQSLLATWDTLSKSKPDRAAAERDYLAAMTAYLDSQASGIDGVWALDHAKFLCGRFSEPVLNRMEYWANSDKDRAILLPIARLADRLLKQSAISLAVGLHQAETRTPFDEANYGRAFTALAELEYYNVWGAYLLAMAMDPADPARKELLTTNAHILNKWADDREDNGVNAPSLLLRGKMESEAGDFDAAGADLTRSAHDTHAPAWVQYQAHYQLVVSRLRAGLFDAANGELSLFNKSLPPDNLDAQLSTEMLAYRVAWAEAQTKTGNDKTHAESDALAILGNILARDPRFRDLVYEQLAASLPENADTASLQPMQQLAVAYASSQGQRGDTPESRAALERAAAAAVSAHDNPKANPAEKLEATFLAGVTNALLKRFDAAVHFNIEFAEQAPTDPRAKPLLDTALEQIGELRKTAAASGKSNPDLLDLQGRALALATNNFHDTRWRYAQARTLEDGGKIAEAAAIFEAIPPEDKNYLDARFRLVAIATARFTSLPATASPDDLHAAAKRLFDACHAYLDLLDHPPASVDPQAVARAKAYRVDIWLIETSTALNPIVKQPDIAQDNLNKLRDADADLSPAQRDAVLRYQIQLYQLKGQTDQAFDVVQIYAQRRGAAANDVIRALAYATLEDITAAEQSDPQRARQLAAYVVKLLDPLIAAARHDPAQKQTLYDYQKLRSDMLLKSGDFANAQSLALQLQADHPDDLFNYMTQARGLFEEARSTADAKLYAKAEDLFSRILPQLNNGSDSFWEAWLRILQSKELLAGPDAADTLKKRLADLRSGFGEKIGGDKFKPDFTRLLQKYDVQ